MKRKTKSGDLYPSCGTLHEVTTIFDDKSFTLIENNLRDKYNEENQDIVVDHYILLRFINFNFRWVYKIKHLINKITNN